MCGIVGYVGYKNAAEEVYRGLTRLEYRGYDSAGVSVLGEDIETVKRRGRVKEIEKDVLKLEGRAAIGHTRWATHGEASDINAHPHASGLFSVAHNGIIENYRELKAELQSKGYKFVSQTDSEVIVHLLNYCYCGDLTATVRAAVKRLKGSFALAILCKDFEGICAVKYKSPVILGLGEGENYVASDAPALCGKADKIIIPEDGDVALLTAEGITVLDGDNKAVNRDILPLECVDREAETGGCPHYMLKEIRECAQTVRNACSGFYGGAESRLKELLDDADKIIIVGCGTAYNCGLAAKRWLESAYNKDCTVEIASEARYNPPRCTSRTVAFAVSQSGETADTIGAAETLKSAGAVVVAVTNVIYSAITRVADVVVPVCAGAEICVAATKSYIGQLTCFYLVSRLAYGEKTDMNYIAKALESVAFGCAEAEEIARIAVGSSAVFFLGRGADYPVAIEGSLKLKEVSYIFSDAYPAGELKHGTLALIDENVLCVAIICDDRMKEKCENAVEQIISRRGKVAVVTCYGDICERFSGRVAVVCKIPDAVPASFSAAVALQKIAYGAAVIKGIDPDKPRNLAKSVTVE